MHIRQATPADAAPIARLCTQLGYASDASAIGQRLAALAGRTNGCTVLVAEINGLVAGLMQVSIHAAIESGEWAEVDAFVVDESVRRQGVGRALVEYARSFASARGLKRLRVRTNERRADAHAFYAAIGFAHTKSQRIYDLAVSDSPTPEQTR